MKKIILIVIAVLLLPLALAEELTTEELTITYSNHNKFGLIRGEQKVTDAIYNKLIRLGDTAWLFYKRGKYGIIDNEGNILVEPNFSSAQRFVGHYAKLGRGGLYGIYDNYGKLIIDREYSSIDILYGRMFLVCKNYKYGLISFDGDILLAPIADDIYMPKPNILKILYDGNWYEIEHIGKETMQIPKDIADLELENSEFKITTLVQNPVISASYGVVSFSDYLIKVFSSISPAYEKTIDELILNHGADTATILMKSSWLVKFPFVYGKNYYRILVAPNNGPLSDVKSSLKHKIK